MIDDKVIEQLHNRLEELKRLNKVSYSKIGAIIGYSGEGVNKALRKKTLSISQINKIGKELGFEDELNKLLPTNSNNYNFISNAAKDNIEETVIYIIENEKKLLQNATFKLWLKTKIQERIIETYEKAKNSP